MSFWTRAIRPVANSVIAPIHMIQVRASAAISS